MFGYFFSDPKTVALLNLNRKLRELFGSERCLSQFRQNLETSGAVLSGSFLVQAILGEWWTGSDLDIFLPLEYLSTDAVTPTSPLSRWLDQNYSPGVPVDVEKCEYSGCQETVHNNLQIRKIFEHGSVNQMKVQVIYVDLPREQLKEYIDRTFDFVLCKNTYRILDGDEQLEIKDIGQVTGRMIGLDPDRKQGVNLVRIGKRAKKYIERGFRLGEELAKDLVLLDRRQREVSLADVDPSKVTVWPVAPSHEGVVQRCQVLYEGEPLVLVIDATCVYPPGAMPCEFQRKDVPNNRAKFCLDEKQFSQLKELGDRLGALLRETESYKKYEQRRSHPYYNEALDKYDGDGQPRRERWIKVKMDETPGEDVFRPEQPCTVKVRPLLFLSSISCGMSLRYAAP
jgi:hypothetical protein